MKEGQTDAWPRNFGRRSSSEQALERQTAPCQHHSASPTAGTPRLRITGHTVDGDAVLTSGPGGGALPPLAAPAGHRRASGSSRARVRGRGSCPRRAPDGLRACGCQHVSAARATLGAGFWRRGGFAPLRSRSAFSRYCCAVMSLPSSSTKGCAKSRTTQMKLKSRSGRHSPVGPETFPGGLRHPAPTESCIRM